MYHKFLSDSFFVLALCCLFLSAISYGMCDVWLASTQWVLVSIVFFLIAIYVKLSKEEDEKIIAGYKKQAKSVSKKKNK